MWRRADARLVAVILLLAAGALALASCGGDSDSSETAAGSATTEAAGSTEAASDTEVASDGESSGGEEVLGEQAEGDLAGPDQEIVVASNTPPDTLDPLNTLQGGAYNVTWRLADGLVGLDAKGDIVPVLAEAPPTQVDDLTWEATIRKDVKFSNGKPLTAADVVASIEQLTDPNFTTVIGESEAFDAKKPAWEVDKYTVRMKTAEPDPTFPNKLVSVKVVDMEAGGDRATKPIGTGPYMLESYKPGAEAVLVYNPEYYGEKPQVTRVVIRFLTDEVTRVQALQAGEVDLVPFLSPDQVPNVEYYAAASIPTVSSILKLNAYEEPLDDVRVRQALNYAVDREALADQLFLGYAKPQECQINSYATDANENLKIDDHYPYDPEKARELVEEAGATGKKYVLSWPTSGMASARAYGTVLAEMLEETGLDVELKFMEYNQFLDGWLTNDPKGMMSGIAPGTNPTGTALRSLGLFYPTDGQLSQFSNKEVDRLNEKAQTTFDPAQRQKWIDELTTAACEDAALLYTIEWQDLFGLSDRVNWQPGAGDTSGRLFFDEMSIVEPS